MEGAIGGRARRWRAREEGGQRGGTIGLVRSLGLGEVAVVAQGGELEESRWNAEHLPCCRRHLVSREE